IRRRGTVELHLLRDAADLLDVTPQHGGVELGLRGRVRALRPDVHLQRPAADRLAKAPLELRLEQAVRLAGPDHDLQEPVVDGADLDQQREGLALVAGLAKAGHAKQHGCLGFDANAVRRGESYLLLRTDWFLPACWTSLTSAMIETAQM